MASSTVLQGPDLGAAYQKLYDALGRAYWDASDVPSKDLVHGAQEAIGEIITAINKQGLADNTALFAKMGAKIKATNAALKKIEGQIDQITKNIQTAASVIDAISKILALFP